MGKHYVNSQELEEWWQGWIVTKDPYAWEQVGDRIYLICSGIATKFNPRDDEEKQEHIHDAWTQTMDKIKSGKLRFISGKAPVFNLITTTVYRILFSKMNRDKKGREHYRKYAAQLRQKHKPEFVDSPEGFEDANY